MHEDNVRRYRIYGGGPEQPKRVVCMAWLIGMVIDGA